VIGGWVLKLVVAFGLLAIAAFEIGSPVIARVQLDDSVHQAADNSAQTFFQTRSADAAKATAQQVAQDKGIVMLDFSVDDQGSTHVRAEKKAHGIFFDRWKQTRRYYHIVETATGHYNNS